MTDSTTSANTGKETNNTKKELSATSGKPQPQSTPNTISDIESSTPDADNLTKPTEQKVSENVANNTKTSRTNSNTTQTSQRSATINQRKKANLAMPISILALVLAITVGATLFYNDYKKTNVQGDEVAKLEAKLDALQQAYDRLNNAQASQTQQNQQLNVLIENTNKSLSRYQEEQSTRFGELQNKVSALSTTDANAWLLSEADFLVKQAVRKLNTERDVTTAATLLASAETNLIELNDPSLTDIRRALAQDINTLRNIAHFDADGVIIKLENLSTQLDNLPMPIEATVNKPLAGSTTNDTAISDSLTDWQENLSKSWKGFMADFITVKERNPTVDNSKPELTINQKAYLRENIRLQLLIAGQSVSRQQQQVYHQALTQAVEWIKSYYDVNDAKVQSVITELQTLLKLNIKVDMPTELTSQPLLDKAVQARVRSLLAHNTATNNGQGV